jgi:hypothetical protein
MTLPPCLRTVEMFGLGQSITVRRFAAVAALLGYLVFQLLDALTQFFEYLLALPLRSV